MARVVLERRRMCSEDEMCLQKYTMEIEEILEAEEVIGILFSKYVIDINDMDNIKAGRTRLERVQRLMGIVMTRGVDALPKFITSLDDMGYQDLAKKLENCRTGKSKESTEDWSEKLADSFSTTNLNMEMSSLRRRLAILEQTGANNADMDTLRSDINVKFHNLESTLNKIAKLATVSRETVDEMNKLRRQVKEKEMLLSAARRQIKELQSQVSNLEREIVSMNQRMEMQEESMDSLESKFHLKNKHWEKQDRDRKMTEQKVAILERDKKSTEAKVAILERDKKSTEAKMETLEEANTNLQRNQDKMLNMFTSFVAETRVARKRNPNTRYHSKNRFQ